MRSLETIFTGGTTERKLLALPVRQLPTIEKYDDLNLFPQMIASIVGTMRKFLFCETAKFIDHNNEIEVCYENDGSIIINFVVRVDKPMQLIINNNNCVYLMNGNITPTPRLTSNEIKSIMEKSLRLVRSRMAYAKYPHRK